jgi:hypothetical protein
MNQTTKRKAPSGRAVLTKTTRKDKLALNDNFEPTTSFLSDQKKKFTFSFNFFG